MPEVTKIGYFLTDLIKKVDFLGTQCICNLTIYVANCTHGCSAECGCPRRSRDTRRLWTSSSARRQTPDPRHRSGWVVVEHLTCDTGQVEWWSNSQTPDPRHRSGWVVVELPTCDTGQVEWWSNSQTPDPLHRSGSRRTSRRRRSTRRDDLDRCRATDIRDPPLSHTSSSHHPSLVDPRDGIVL